MSSAVLRLPFHLTESNLVVDTVPSSLGLSFKRFNKKRNIRTVACVASARDPHDQDSKMLLEESRFDPLQQTRMSSSAIGRRFLAQGAILCFISFSTAEDLVKPPLGLAVTEPSGVDSTENKGLAGVLSLFNSDEVSKSGRKLPRGYLESAREVVKALKDSLSENPEDDLKFRRSADSAKLAIKVYLGSWRGAPTIANEESYLALERALRELGQFYGKQGPRAVMPPDVKGRVEAELDLADAAL